jgi:hypothetical protein
MNQMLSLYTGHDIAFVRLTLYDECVAISNILLLTENGLQFLGPHPGPGLKAGECIIATV